MCNILKLSIPQIRFLCLTGQFNEIILGKSVLQNNNLITIHLYKELDIWLFTRLEIVKGLEI